MEIKVNIFEHLHVTGAGPNISHVLLNSFNRPVWQIVIDLQGNLSIK